MSTVKIRSLTTTATTTASDDFLVIDGTTNSTRKLSAATPAFLTSVTVPTVATAAGVNLNLATGTAASDKVLIPGTLEATAADGLAASIGTLGGASVKKALWVGGIINVAGHTTFEGVTSTGATGTGKLVYDTSPSLTTPALGTPSALLGTNITGTAAGLTAGNVTTNADLTGDVTSVGNATSIAAGVIVNADINASAAIVDTKLDTISSALKVSNSATTAASANTASAIVARDASGNFSAGTVSAALTGNAATATALATARTIAITGDLAYTSPSFDGSGNVTAAGTLASVASAGTTGGSTAIPVVTINAKGLTTSITTAVVIAPASTLTGATLASGVTASSLTSLGTIASLAVTAGTISGTPSASTDIANKLYVDTVAQGLDAKASCIAATTANITLSGTQTIDGISVIAADRVLVKDQTLSQNNGIYLCAAGAWTRTTDADTWDELTSAFVFIETGTVNADTGWVCTANAGGTLGTTALPWSQFSGAGSYTASTGLTLTGTVFSLTAPVTVALGGTNATSAGIASFNNITGYTASGATGTTSTNLVFSTSPTITSPTITGGALNGTLGATTPSSVAATTGTFSSTLGVTGVATLGNGAILGTPASGNLASCTGYVGTSALVTVGALNSGSITSGFGAIDVGADAISGGAGAFSTLSASGLSTLSSGIAVRGNTSPASGAGLELVYDGTQSVIQSYNRTSPAYQPLWLEGGTLVRVGLGGSQMAGFSSTGLAVTGAVTATGNVSTTGGDVLIRGAAGGQITQNGGAGGLYIANTGTSTSMRLLVTNGAAASVTALTLAADSGAATFASNVAITGTLSATNAATITANSSGYGLLLNGRSSDNLTVVAFRDNTGATNYGGFEGSSSSIKTQIGSGFTTITNVTSTGLAVTGALSSSNTFSTFNNSTQELWRSVWDGGNTGGISSPSGRGLYLTTSGTASTQGIFINGSGAVLLGTTSQVNAGLISLAFDTGTYCGIATKPTNNAGYDAARFFNSSTTQIGSISCTTSATAYNISSDIRLKTNVRSLTNSGAIIDALKPSLFDWKSGEKDSYGFIAQEVYPIFPQAVTKGDDDADTITAQWQMDAGKFMPLAIAELKSLRKRLAALESK